MQTSILSFEIIKLANSVIMLKFVKGNATYFDSLYFSFDSSKFTPEGQ